MSDSGRKMSLAEFISRHEGHEDFAALKAAIARVTAERDALESMRQAVFERDAKDGCCAPGEWCCFKPYSQLAVEHAEALKRIAAIEAERDALRVQLEGDCPHGYYGWRSCGICGDKIARLEAERDAAVAKLKRALENEAMCHCGSMFSDHTIMDNHSPVEMKLPCPNEKELTAARAEAGEIAASVREHLDWIEVACIGGGFQHNMTCQETLGLVLDHARLAKSALDRKGAGL